MDSVFLQQRNFFVLNIIGVCANTQSKCLEEIMALPKEPVSATVSFVGIPAVISAKENCRCAEVYNAVTYVAIDGMPIVKKARKAGIDCERCSGPEMMQLILEKSVQEGKTHYFYGGANIQVLNALQKNLEEKFPGIQIVGMYSPPFRPLTEEEDAKLCEEINECKPDFVWVGIGAPKQDIWMMEHCERINGTVMLGVGAAFDFFAGTLDKAPEWVAQSGFEWLYRLMKEPKRLWRRYVLGGFKYLYYSVEAKLKKK